MTLARQGGLDHRRRQRHRPGRRRSSWPRPAAGWSSRAAMRPSSTPRCGRPKRTARRPARSSTAPLDVADSDAVARVAQDSRRGWAASTSWSTAPASISAKRYWSETDSATFNEVVAVNLNGAMACTLAVLPGMRARREGTVINVASFAGWHYGYLTGPAYTASKAALMALTPCLQHRGMRQRPARHLAVPRRGGHADPAEASGGAQRRGDGAHAAGSKTWAAPSASSPRCRRMCASTNW